MFPCKSFAKRIRASLCQLRTVGTFLRTDDRASFQGFLLQMRVCREREALRQKRAQSSSSCFMRGCGHGSSHRDVRVCLLRHVLTSEAGGCAQSEVENPQHESEERRADQSPIDYRQCYFIISLNYQLSIANQ